jgi:hypothetical protein
MGYQIGIMAITDDIGKVMRSAKVCTSVTIYGNLKGV